MPVVILLFKQQGLKDLNVYKSLIFKG